VLLAKRWIAVTEDPEKGKDQSRDAFWDKVAEQIKERNGLSCMKTFQRMALAVQKFSSIMFQVSEKKVSGTTFDDTLQAALEMYAVDRSGQFKYLESWKVLKECPKFQQHVAAVPSLSSFASPTGTTDITGVLESDMEKEIPRPIGCKAAKKAASRKRLFRAEDEAGEDSRAKMSIALVERNEILKRQNDINSEANAIQLFCLEKDDEVSQEYLRLLKLKKLTELKASMGL
jgi:hypothetical protein